jgi:hypothetical protein
MVDEDESWRDLCAWLSDNGASGLDGAACSVAPATFNMVRVPCVALVARVGNAVDRESSLPHPPGGSPTASKALFACER